MKKSLIRHLKILMSPIIRLAAALKSRNPAKIIRNINYMLLFSKRPKTTYRTIPHIDWLEDESGNEAHF